MYQQYQPYQPYQRQEYIPSNIPGLVQPQTQPGIRPVASREEAAVAQIPFDGTAAYFLNTATGEIYAKAFRADGTAPLVTYRRVDETPIQYATIDQLNAVMAEIERLKKPGKAVKKDEE